MWYCRYFPNSGRGATLPELLIATVVSTLVVTGAYRMFRSFAKDDLVQQNTATAQNELLPAQKILEREIRRASQGMPSVTITRDSLGRSVGFYSIEVVKQTRGATSLTLRGNFSGTRAQLRQDALKADTWMNLQTGSARGFAVNDLVLLEAGDVSEVAKVLETDTVASRLRLQTRLQDFPAGANVVKVTSISFERKGVNRLVYRGETGRYDTLSRNLNLMAISLRTLAGALDSTAPLDLAQGRGIAYTLTVKQPKTAGARDSLSRSVTGEVTLRNLML
jgi:hypothetical protein